MAAITTALQQVFSTTELGEAILLQLPVQDILFATRVCSVWRKLILTSSAFRKRLLVWKVAGGSELTLRTVTHKTWLFHTDFIEGTMFGAREEGREIFVLMTSASRPLRALRRDEAVRSSFDGCVRGGVWEVKWYDSAGGRLVFKKTFTRICDRAPIGYHYFDRYHAKPATTQKTKRELAELKLGLK
ncbi:hypothetical protein LTR85_001885 [Meristemomyces frigidus]|nr:hypothetical protein LTR85_001885 [Meristemomyces frigidus]